MGFVKKYKIEVIVSLVIITLYLLLRLLSLLQLPIFTDEAIYLRWAQIAKNDASWRFISLTDGKQPLFIWLTIVAMRLIHDPLVAGRVVSVVAGLGTMVGLFLLGREAFKNRWVGILSAGLYALFPFALIYDRMALYDSLVGTFTVWGIYFTILLTRSMQLDRAFMLGFVAGAAVLNKTNGFFTIYLLPLALILVNFKLKTLRPQLLRFFGLSLVVVIMTYGFYSILRLSPFFYIINEKNSIFFYPVQEWIRNPFAYFPANISAFMDWLFRYVGLPILILVLSTLILSKNYFREKVYLLLWFVIPFIGFALDAKTIYPRYIFPMTLSLLPLAAYALVLLYEKLSLKKWLMVFGLALIYWVLTVFLILYNFSGSPIPSSDRVQYLTAWPSGVGVDKIEDYIQHQAVDKKVFLTSQGTFGLLPYAFELTFYNNPNVTVKGYWPIEKQPPRELLDMAKKEDTYIVFYQNCSMCEGVGIAPSSWPLTKVMQIKRIEADSYITLYKVSL